MVDIVDTANLPQLFASRAAVAQKESQDVIVAAGEAIETITAADTNLAFSRQQTSVDVETVIDNMDAIQGNIERAVQNPFQPLIKLWNPDFNLRTQQTRLNRQNLELNKVRHRSNVAESTHKLAIEDAGRELGLQETEAAVAQRNLGNLTTQINIGIQTRSVMASERERTLGGMLLPDIDAAIADPSLLGDNPFDIRPGDLNIARLEKQSAITAANNITLDMQLKRTNLTKAQMEQRQTTMATALSSTPREVLDVMLAEANAGDGFFERGADLAKFTGVPLPAGLKIPASIIAGVIQKKNDDAKTQSTSRAAEFAAASGAESTLLIAEQGLLTAQGQRTGVYATDLDMSTFTPREQGEIQSAQQLIEAAQVATREDAIQLQIKAGDKLSALQADIDKQLLVATPDNEQAAMQEFLSTRQIASTANAVTVLAPALLDINSIVASSILASFLPKLQIEALKIREEESIGVDAFGAGFISGKAKKRDDEAFVAQVVSNGSISTVTGKPVAYSTAIGGKAMVNYTAQIMELLAKQNPQAWGGFVTQGNWTSAVAGGDNSVSEADIMREIKRRDLTLRKSGAILEGEPSLYSIFKGELNNPILKQNFILTNLTPATRTEAALWQRLTGNGQVTAFNQRLAILDAQESLQIEQLDADPNALQTEQQRSAFGVTDVPRAIRDILINQQAIVEAVVGVTGDKKGENP